MLPTTHISSFLRSLAGNLIVPSVAPCLLGERKWARWRFYPSIIILPDGLRQEVLTPGAIGHLTRGPTVTRPAKKGRKFLSHRLKTYNEKAKSHLRLKLIN